MEINLVAEAFKFLILGMSTVFVFLVLMVYVLEIQSRILTKYFPAKEQSRGASNPAKEKKSNHDNLQVIAAITTAIRAQKQSN